MNKCPHCDKEINIGKILVDRRYSKITPEKREAIGEWLRKGREKARKLRIEKKNSLSTHKV